MSASAAPLQGAPEILVVEDEPAIADTILYALRTEGMGASHLTLGKSALLQLREKDYALAIIDVGLPDINGFELCRQLRRFSDLPVISLTARNDEVDRIVGLEIGADDYIAKPFSPRELAARVHVILRRGRAVFQSTGKSSQTSSFRIDQSAHRIYCGEEMLPLTRYEYELLVTFLNQPGRVFTREELMQRIWTAPHHSMERTVDAHIKTLRAKVRSALSGIDPIETHRGIGYSLKRGT